METAGCEAGAVEGRQACTGEGLIKAMLAMAEFDIAAIEAAVHGRVNSTSEEAT